MCGICGIVHFDGTPVDALQLERMNNKAQHRGPDAAGYHIKDNIGFGHRRLAILDLSQKGHQPMHFEGLSITFNGEIYNFLDLRQELTAIGYSFYSNSDTEVLLKAYHAWGSNCLDKLNGMFAFAILDSVQNCIFCARDRFGIKPFYYKKTEESFFFASEIKQFTILNHCPATVNATRAYEFLVHGWHDHTEATFFNEIHQLPAGNYGILNLQSGCFDLKAYYQYPLPDVQKKRKPKYHFKNFKDLLYNAVQKRLLADVRVGTALSGGIDSSSIVGVIKAVASDGKYDCVAACFEQKAFSEEEWVDAMAEHHDLTVYKVNPQFEELWELWSKVTYHQDEPIASASVMAQFKVFQKANAQGIKVMLDGQGADEILAGYDKFYAPYFRRLLKINPFAAAIALYRYKSLHGISWAQIIHAAVNRDNTPNTYSKHLSNAFAMAGQNTFKRAKDSSIYKCSKNLMTGIGLPILLHYEDRNSMAHSVESRVPFLDHQLVDCAMKLPDALKIHYGKRKYILRETMKTLLPSKIYHRYDKMGFVTPQEFWMEEHSQRFLDKARQIIESNPSFFNQNSIRFIQKVLQHKEKQHYAFIWRVIAFGVWLEVFNIQHHTPSSTQ